MNKKHPRYYASIVFVFLGVVIIGTVCAAGEAGPEDIIKQSIGTLDDDCDFACCYAVAGLYTERFLGVTRAAIIASLKANAQVGNVIRQGFGGTVTTLAEVEALAPRELFAWHLHDTVLTVPAKYRYTQLEILDTRHRSPDKIEYVVRLSGVKAVPSTQEEAFYRVVREKGQWKIDQ